MSESGARTKLGAATYCAVLVSVALVTVGCPLLKGDNQRNQVDGSIDDGDAGTGPGANYSSTRNIGEVFDGDAKARSDINSFKHLQSFVLIDRVPNPVGPFTDPAGAASSKVRSTFKVTRADHFEFRLDPGFLVKIDGEAPATVQILVSVLRGTGTPALAVNNSVFSVHYEIREDPNQPDRYRYTISRSDGSSSSGSERDRSGFQDTESFPGPFRLGAGEYTVVFELNTRGQGRLEHLFLDSECRFDLVRY